jgi:hypothetical protein
VASPERAASSSRSSTRRRRHRQSVSNSGRMAPAPGT